MKEENKQVNIKESSFLFGNNRGPEILKILDNISIEVNSKIKKRGIGRGMICIVEDFNKNILSLEKLISRAYLSKNFNEKIEIITNTTIPLKDMWLDIRYLYKNKGLTVGEIGVLSKFSFDVQTQIQRWYDSTRTKAMEGQG